jgi:hypothetical protein
MSKYCPLKMHYNIIIMSFFFVIITTTPTVYDTLIIYMKRKHRVL